MNCKKCGSQIFENEQFCRNCGERIASDNQVNNQQVENNLNNNISKNYKLILNRKKNFVGCLVKYSIYIDNQLVGKIKNGQTLEFDISAGIHQISINKNNAVNITINSDTTADIVVFGANNFGITNINGQLINNNINNNALKNESTTNTVFLSSIILPIVSIIMLFLIQYCIAFWIYALLIGYAIVNISGLKNQKGSSIYKKLMIKNIIAIILLSISLVVTAYLTL